MTRRAAVLVCVGLLLASTRAHAGTVSVQVSSSSGGVEGALVLFDPQDETPPPAHGVASIDQVGKQFVPRVSIIRTGTAVTFPNSDNIRHQVYSFSKAKPFTLKLYSGSPAAPVLFDKAGLVLLGCNIHDRMVAFVDLVVEAAAGRLGRDAVDQEPDQAGPGDGDQDRQRSDSHGPQG